MSPFTASATVVNLVLATGPFTYPFGYVSLGPVIAAPLLFFTAILAHISATYIIEAVSIAGLYANEEETSLRTQSLFQDECYKTPKAKQEFNNDDADMKES
jgi:hypothetical protein